MFGIGWKVAAVMGALALAGGGYGVWQGKVAEKANARAARAERAVEAIERTLEAERQAAAVLAAERDRFEERAAEYDALREALIEGGDDAQIPDWLAAYLGSLLSPGGTGRPDSPD